jgi:hypothetical protein
LLGSHANGRILRQRRHRLIDDRRLDERLVPLDVYDQVAGHVPHHLGDAIGPGRVRRRRHARRAAEPTHRVGDPRIVGRDQHLVEECRPDGPLDHMLHHRLSGELRQRLAGKSAGGIPRGDDADNARLHAASSRLVARDSPLTTFHPESPAPVHRG